MRFALLYNPRLLCERLAVESHRRRRLARLKDTPASRLSLGHVDSLELLELLHDIDIGVIYDVGASLGTWTLLAKSVVPLANIHAFEPLPKHCEGFSAATAKFKDVKLHRVALGAEEKETTILVTDFSDLSSVLPLTISGKEIFGIYETERLPVQLTTLDRHREKLKLPWPDLIKIDVQGYEVEVLAGAQQCLEHAKAVITEVSFVEFYKEQCLFADVVRVMNDFGFQLHAMAVTTPLGKPLYQTDALFLHRAMLPAAR